MSEPWFDPSTFATLYGAIGGSAVGTLVGGLGGAAGYLAPQGRGRRFVLSAMTVMLVAGLVQVAVGIFAVSVGQPYGIWYPMLLIGGLLTVLMAGLLPAVRKRYAQAEQRRIEAEAIRQA